VVRKQINPITDKAVEYIGKLYPVLYADEFGWNEVNRTDASYESIKADDGGLKQKRKELINSALSNENAAKRTKPLEQIAHFKPFNIRELDWEIFDASD